VHQNLTGVETIDHTLEEDYGCDFREWESGVPYGSVDRRRCILRADLKIVCVLAVGRGGNRPTLLRNNGYIVH
jgi:hypothetical protein